MGEMIFLLPAGMDAAARRSLERACLAGGPESVPWPTMAVVEGDRLVLTRETGESGCLHAPWLVEGSGRFMISSCTLMERETPYRFLLELARGKLNQVRNQAWDWRSAGLEIPAPFVECLRRAQRSFRTAVSASSPEVADLAASDTLETLTQCGTLLVEAYVEQVFQLRRARVEGGTFELGCRYDQIPPAAAESALLEIGSYATLAFSWKDIERGQGSFTWEKADALIEWAEAHQLQSTGGPLIDLGLDALPEWLLTGQHDVNHLARVMCRFAMAVVRRYHPRIRRWVLTRGSNCATAVHITEHAMLWLNLRLAQTVRQVAPEAELVIAITRPWGDYLAVEDREHSPFVFADMLLRSEINLAALEVEIVMGGPGRESYARDLLETSRMLDYYSLLGSPIRVVLGYPVSVPKAEDAESIVTEGNWAGGTVPEAQASWAAAFIPLALCKPYVQAVSWICQRANSQAMTGCQLWDATGSPTHGASELGKIGQSLKANFDQPI
ncbi:hypothetical protein BH10PLA2_BH10PLA2_24050 [soil metagenome]